MFEANFEVMKLKGIMKSFKLWLLAWHHDCKDLSDDV